MLVPFWLMADVIPPLQVAEIFKQAEADPFHSYR
jgi:hypothetical protein